MADRRLLTLFEHKRFLFLKDYADTPVERRIRLIGIEVFLVGFAGDLGDFLRSEAEFYQDPPCRIRTIAGELPIAVILAGTAGTVGVPCYDNWVG